MRLMIFLSRYLMAVIVWGWMLKTFFRWYVVRLFKREVTLPCEKESQEDPTYWLARFEMDRHKFYFAAHELLFAVSSDPVAAHRSIRFLWEHSNKRKFGWRALRKTLIIYLQSFLQKHPDDYDSELALKQILKQLRNIQPDPNPSPKMSTSSCKMPPLGCADLRMIPQSHVFLFEAISEGRLNDVKRALSEGGNPNIRDEYLRTPLMAAISDQRKEIVDLLLVSGADVNAMDRLEYTPLYYAILSGQVETVRELLKADANPNQKEGVYLSTPLMTAICQGHIEIVKMLLDAGADPWAESIHKHHAISYAIGYIRMDIFEYLLSKGLDLKHGGSRQVTPLRGAIGYECPQSVALLIAHGADVNDIGPDGATHLMYAARIGNEELVRILLDAGADRSLKDNNGRTALDWAKTDEVKRLLLEQATTEVQGDRI